MFGRPQKIQFYTTFKWRLTAENACWSKNGRKKYLEIFEIDHFRFIIAQKIRFLLPKIVLNVKNFGQFHFFIVFIVFIQIKSGTGNRIFGQNSSEMVCFKKFEIIFFGHKSALESFGGPPKIYLSRVKKSTCLRYE